MTTDYTDAQRATITGLTSEDGWPDAQFTPVDDNAVAKVVSHRTGDALVLIVRPDGSVLDRTLGTI